MTTSPIRVAIVGVGNCASSLVQGLGYYGTKEHAPLAGLMHDDIGGWGCSDIHIVAAFDVDSRKVGQPLSKALFASPNCATRFWSGEVPGGSITVVKGPVADGVAGHMAEYEDERSFRISTEPEVDPAQILRDSHADVLVSYLPVGSDNATQLYAEACLQTGCAMVNCAPSFIAANTEWAKRFRNAGVPIVGDDIKSQLGATIVHRALAHIFAGRGIDVKHTYQLNTGGNTDFLNMLARDRLSSKKLSKTRAVQSQFDQPLDDWRVHIGPSDYVPWQKDNKICFLRMEGEGFGGQPIELEMRLSVQDSPNSAGIVVDAIRCAALARRRGLAGPIKGVSAWLMKSPPEQMADEEAKKAMKDFIVANEPVELKPA